MDITLDSRLQAAAKGHLHLGIITADVVIKPSPEALLATIAETVASIQANYRVEDIATMPPVSALREVYKALGKKPQKYRGSNEALLRRVIKGNDLYLINNVVDINNLISLSSKRSVGSYDAACISQPIQFGVGNQGEPYQGIGRGQLNIANLPVFRDKDGAFGSPTSDSERTRIQPQTKALCSFIIGFDGDENLSEDIHMAASLLEKYASGQRIQTNIVRPD